MKQKQENLDTKIGAGAGWGNKQAPFGADTVAVLEDIIRNPCEHSTVYRAIKSLISGVVEKVRNSDSFIAAKEIAKEPEKYSTTYRAVKNGINAIANAASSAGEYFADQKAILSNDLEKMAGRYAQVKREYNAHFERYSALDEALVELTQKKEEGTEKYKEIFTKYITESATVLRLQERHERLSDAVGRKLIRNARISGSYDCEGSLTLKFVPDEIKISLDGKVEPNKYCFSK